MPGIHGKDKDKEMEHYPGHKDDDKDMRMLRPEVQEEKLTEEEVEKFAMEDLYTSAEKAEEKAKAMGISGSHMHIHKIDDREIKMYMPGESHEQYMEAKKKMMEKEEEMMDDEEKMAITPKDVHTKRPIGTYEQDDCDCEESKSICDCKEEQKNNAVEQTFNLNGVEIFSTGS